MGCQKPCWNQARLSRLVNKQVASGGVSRFPCRSRAPPLPLTFCSPYAHLQIPFRFLSISVHLGIGATIRIGREFSVSRMRDVS